MCFALSTSAVAAQEPPVTRPSRPKIGIAFSGGGAKGSAHIGVLKVFEEMHIPIDYAAGTSMGAIIGGLYASGLSPAELEKIMLEIDWADALIDRPSRHQLQFRRKNDDLHYISDLELGIGGDGLKYPLGLRSGQKLNYLLGSMTLPVRSVNDFDDLPIPFRAVATDIATGTPVVLDHGDLARAMRASMAIPTAFSPVELDGKLLVDGGVSNNIPVDVVRAMGADIVIAIDIGAPLLQAQQVRRSFLTILDQTLGLTTRGNMAARLEDADLVLTPEVAGFGTLDFGQVRKIIDLGEAEARKQASELERLSIPEEEYAAWRAGRRREPDPIPVIREVRVEGNARVDSRIITPLIHARGGQPFSPEVARDDLNRIFGLADFEAVDLVLEPREDGTDLVYSVREKPWGPVYLRSGLAFDAEPPGENALTLLAGIRATRLNTLGAEWATDFQIGEHALVRSEFYQPLEFDAGWFVAPSAGYGRRPLGLFSEGDRVAELEVQGQDARLDLGYVFWRYGEIRLGIERSWIQVGRESGVVPPELETFLDHTIDHGAIRLQGTADRLDNAKLPKNGFLVHLDSQWALESLGSDADSLRIEGHFSYFRTRGRHTGFGEFGGGASPDGVLPPYDRFVLGGFLSLTGFERGEITGDNYGVARAGYYYRFSKLFHVGGYFEAAQVGDEPEEVFEDPITTATALLVADTGAGPIYLALGAADGGQTTAYISFGRRF